MNNYTNKDIMIIQVISMIVLSLSLTLLISLVPIVENMNERLTEIESSQITQNSHWFYDNMVVWRI